MGKFLGLLACMTLLYSCKDKPEPIVKDTQKPNIILIMADDQGWGDLGFNGNTNLSTPHIDALGSNGASFEHFFVQPVCSPTRAELLTGRYAGRMGVHSTSTGGERINIGETTLAEILKKAGYATAAYGKWHSGMQPPYHPNARGFDDYYGFTSGHWGNYFSPMLEHNGAIVKGDGYLVDDLTDHGLEFITKNKDKPFFLYLPYNTPHSPMQVPDAYWDRFTGIDLPMKYQGTEIENDNFTKAALAMVENIDDNVGRITNTLKELELEKNTMVIYLSDNGPNGWRWNGGMRGRKGSTDEGGVRTSFFIQWTDSIPKGRKIEQIAGAVDILPTLANLANITYETKGKIDGKNLSSLLFNEQPAWEPRTIYNHWRGKTSLRIQGYRLDHEDHLYDMVQDHGQKKDISAELPELTDSLKALKKEWLSGMPLLTKETDTRPFPLGHPEYIYTQIPARDGISIGGIERSSVHPNNTFFTNWKSLDDEISWNTEVLADGEFEVTLYYTCSEKNVGSTIQLTHGSHSLTSTISEAHDPPLTGMENDRDPRIESYVKDFKALKLGTMKLTKAKAPLLLKAMDIPGEEVADIRLLMFKRI